MNGKEFRSILDSLRIENVFIYVGDAVRWDYLSSDIDSQGVTIKTVAASTHSPTSFASLVSGLDAQSHGVYTFSDRLSRNVDGLFDFPERATRFVNSVFHHGVRHHDRVTDPIHSVLGLSPSSETDPVSGMSGPFISMERGPGGHAPYGEFEGTGFDYFRERGDSTVKELRDDYKVAIERDARLFDRRIESIKANDLTDNTLVVYTSDHGELLGEGGLLGHNGPMRPELVYVPTVFIHPELPDGEITDTIYRHVDLLPTIRSLVSDCRNRYDHDGWSLLADALPERGRCTYRNTYSFAPKNALSLPFHYEGVWDRGGGWALPRTSALLRLLVFAGQLAKSPKAKFLRNNFSRAFRSIIAGATKYGEPAFSVETAEDVLTNDVSEEPNRERVDLSDENEQLLRDLGYI